MADIRIDDTDLKKLMKDKIMVELALALKGDPEKLVASIVHEALSKKKDTHSRTTVFEEMLANEVRTLAMESVKEWIAENKPAISEQMVSLIREQPLAKKLANALTEGLDKTVWFDIRAILKTDSD